MRDSGVHRQRMINEATRKQEKIVSKERKGKSAIYADEMTAGRMRTES